MRYGVISDIHGNLEALQAVLQACYQQNSQGILCMGDIVGYGASPGECLTVLKEAGAICVAGNHDWAVAARLDASYFPSDGKEAINWTRSKLSIDDIALLSSLNLVCYGDKVMMVHSSPYRPEAFTYLNDIAKATQAFNVLEHPVCFIGHTHIPRVYVKREADVINTDTLEFEVRPGYQYVVNVGSVGQPRDGNPMASYVIYDTGMQTVELRRVQYDIRSAQEKIINAGLPGHLARRLMHGR